jgi:hypothetical protein
MSQVQLVHGSDTNVPTRGTRSSLICALVATRPVVFQKDVVNYCLVAPVVILTVAATSTARLVTRAGAAWCNHPCTHESVARRLR